MSGSPKVLVVGAGPTGLTLANALVRYGVSFDIVDRSAGPSRDSKALAINALSRFSFDVLGIAPWIGRHAFALHRLNVHWNGQRLNAVDFRRLAPGSPSLLAQPQWRTEHDLVEALAQCGRRVGWNRRVVEVDTTSPGGTRVRFGETTGHKTESAYTFVVGCDGKRSAVREAANITCRGYDYPFHLLLADVRLRWKARPEGAHYFVYPDGFFILVPMGGDSFRVVIKREGPVSATASRDPSAVGVELARRLGSDVLAGEPTWFSCAHLQMRVADRLRIGRVFLAGDAAHLYSPIGGTGMNTGMQDALNLGWKLAYALSGRAQAERVLDSYEAERLPVIRELAAATDASTRAIARLTTDERLVESFLPSMPKRRILKELALRHSGLAQRYGRSAALDEHRTDADAAATARVGEPFLALPFVARALAAATGAPSPADAMHLVLLLPLPPGDADVTAATELASEVERAYGTFVRAAIVADRAGGDGGRPATISPQRAGRGSSPAPREATAVLVRPDGIVALVQPARSTARVFEFLASIFKRRDESGVRSAHGSSAEGRGEAAGSGVQTRY